tara:strand:- start:104 stop:727 length:624 start_codon:yes stop_codon:yes gene_type:complete
MADLTSLQQSLVNAKKVMNKVDGGITPSGTMSLPQGNINEALTQLPQNVPQLPNVDTDMSLARKEMSPKANMTEDRINKSKLPDAIKKLMISTPIPDVPMGSSMGLSDDFIGGVKEAMNKQDIPTSPHRLEQTITESIIPTSTKNKMTKSSLKSIIKESVKELIDEVVDSKINESANMKTDANENFSFRVGDKMFYGKITSTKQVKK